MRKRSVRTALLCVVVLGGCVGGSVAGTAGQPAVLARGRVPETGRFTLEITAKDPGGDTLVSARGVFDHRNRRFSLDVAGTAAASPFSPRRAIAADGVVYLDFPALARRLGVTTPWISVRTGGDDVLGLRRLDPDRMLDLASSSDAVSMASSSDATVERGDDGLVRRITMRFDARGEDGGVVLTVAYSDLGAPVIIEPPPADQVSDVTEAVNRRSGRRTGG